MTKTELDDSNSQESFRKILLQTPNVKRIDIEDNNMSVGWVSSLPFLTPLPFTRDKETNTEPAKMHRSQGSDTGNVHKGSKGKAGTNPLCISNYLRPEPTKGRGSGQSTTILSKRTLRNYSSCLSKPVLSFTDEKKRRWPSHFPHKGF